MAARDRRGGWRFVELAGFLVGRSPAWCPQGVVVVTESMSTGHGAVGGGCRSGCTGDVDAAVEAVGRPWRRGRRRRTGRSRRGRSRRSVPWLLRVVPWSVEAGRRRPAAGVGGSPSCRSWRASANTRIAAVGRVAVGSIVVVSGPRAAAVVAVVVVVVVDVNRGRRAPGELYRALTCCSQPDGEIYI